MIDLPDMTDKQLDAYEERAAILEYDANMSRPEAEYKALEMVLKQTSEEKENDNA